MTRPEALDLLRTLAHGLRPDLTGTARLQAEAELLRDALADAGALLLLDRWSETEEDSRC
jgi:hypothetical protein